MKLSKIKLNPNNPRIIKDEAFEKLCNSIESFSEMMELRPIIVDENDMILGGNMRYKALQHIGYKDIPDKWIKKASELTEEQKKEFIIKDNVSFGLYDWDLLANEWDADLLNEWGVDLPLGFDEIKETKDIPDIGDTEFSGELMLEHNYIVLYFDNLMDWEVAQEKYKLKYVKSCDPAEKCQKVGIGRVVNGKDFI